MEMVATISDKEFKQIRELVYSRFGINLTEKKRALVTGRLNKVLRDRGFTSFQAYLDDLKADESGKGLSLLVDRISTNHTYFYREPDHFTYFEKTVLPELIQKQRSMGGKSLRIWVAGCSSGEESYMLAMLIREALGREFKNWDVGLLATDISTVALEKAINGVYNKDNITHLPPSLKNRYFKKTDSGDYSVDESLREMILHRRLNLMRKSFPFKGKFQAIFCRNVMIYFDNVTREELLRKFAAVMEPDAFMFIGHSETLGRNNPQFEYIMPAAYRRAERAI
ncbi:MAG TPA: protein-glutamate O-methyltransferase CheR [Bacteroidetes bacterium]|nr:protein-glutamate O-methyltransferase CheR [Bacteroidota bacterium]HEX05155.1 protein-glutamate O-methyltransferase CheR [Bacteroidota bacterium]